MAHSRVARPCASGGGRMESGNDDALLQLNVWGTEWCAMIINP